MDEHNSMLVNMAKWVGLVIMVVLLVNGTAAAIMVAAAEADRDRNGTTPRTEMCRAPQLAVWKDVAEPGSSHTERVGFEPTVHLRVHSISNAAHSAALAPLRQLQRQYYRKHRPGSNGAFAFARLPARQTAGKRRATVA